MFFAGFSLQSMGTRNNPRFDPNPPPRLQAPSLPFKSLLLSIFLFIFGTVFLLIGFSVFWNASMYASLPFSILGGICFIPGAYHVYVFLKVWSGTDQNYKYEMLESYYQ